MPAPYARFNHAFDLTILAAAPKLHQTQHLAFTAQPEYPHQLLIRCGVRRQRPHQRWGGDGTWAEPRPRLM